MQILNLQRRNVLNMSSSKKFYTTIYIKLRRTDKCEWKHK